MSNDITRRLLQSAPVDGMPGCETRLFHITYAPGADSSGHSHPVVGIGMVLEGVMETAFGDDPVVTFTAGQGFMDQTGVHTVSRNGSSTEPMRFVIAYTVRVGEPNTTFPS